MRLKDHRITTIVKGAGNSGVWIYLEPKYFYKPQINNSLFGLAAANFIHVKTDKEAYKELEDVIYLH
jgi:hypothetical protein